MNRTAQDQEPMATSDDFNRLMIRLELFELQRQVRETIEKLPRLGEERFFPTKRRVLTLVREIRDKSQDIVNRIHKLEY